MQSFIHLFQTVHNKLNHGATTTKQQWNNSCVKIQNIEKVRYSNSHVLWLRQMHYMTGNRRFTLKQHCTNHCCFFHKKNKEKLKACSVCSTTTSSLLQFVNSNSKRYLIVLYWFPSSLFLLSVHKRIQSLLLNIYLPTACIFAAQWLTILLHIQDDPQSNHSPKNSCPIDTSCFS